MVSALVPGASGLVIAWLIDRASCQERVSNHLHTNLPNSSWMLCIFRVKNYFAFDFNSDHGSDHEMS